METTEEKDKCYLSETEKGIWFSFSRRHFLSLAGWGLFFAAIGGYLTQLFGYKGFFYPKVLFEPSPRFAAGQPMSFPENSVTKLPSRRVFIVRDGKLLTPRLDNALSGVTRNVILKLAKENGIETTESDLFVYDFHTADEIFVTATSFTIYPVARFNTQKLDAPIPGPVTRQLMSAFSSLVGMDIVQRVTDYANTKTRAK